MKICVVDSFPNHRFTAEKEFIRRLQIAGARSNYEIVKVETSDQILDESPQLVLTTHEFTAKLTNATTLGMLWSPTDFFSNDIQRVRNVLSYDGYLTGSDHVEQYLHDLIAEYPSQRKPIAEFLTLPSCQKLDFKREPGSKRSLFYAGVHWDGYRYGCLFHHLDQHGILNVFGPQKSWLYVEESYRGSIPFDGESLLQTLSEYGVSLCLHRQEHIAADTPSMRLFEAAAAGNLIITDSIPFARRVFGDSVFVLDPTWTDYEKAEFVREKITWAQENPHKADYIASEARDIFEKDWSLDVMLPKIVEFGDQVRSEKLLYSSIQSNPNRTPSLDVIIRCGSRPLSTVKRAVDCVLSQINVDANVVLVDFSDSTDIRDFAHNYGHRVRYISSQRTGFRSSSILDGLRAIKSEYFALLDDDDTVESCHWYQLIAAIEADQHKQNRRFAYSGVVRVEEDGAFVQNPGFNGDLDQQIEERRELKFMDLYDPDRLLIYDNYIQSNAWVAKSSLLQSIDIGNFEDPRLEVAEDVFFYLHFLAATDFIPVFVQTANWHWRSRSAENSMLSVDQVLWRRSMDRAMRRLAQKPFRGITFKSAHHAAWLKSQNAIVNQHYFSKPRHVFNGDSYYPRPGFILEVESDGFRDAEPSGAWSHAELAWIKGYLPGRADAAYVELDLMVPPHPQGRDQRLTIRMNGEQIYSFITPSWHVIKIAKSVFLPEPTDAIILMFTVERCFNPLQMDAGEEERDLGVLLARVLLRPSTPQAATTSLVTSRCWRERMMRNPLKAAPAWLRRIVSRVNSGLLLLLKRY